MTLSDLLAQKPVVLLDGAMGTELASQGVDIGLPLWSANALIKAPQIIRNIHGEYLIAGADIITTNTFRSNKRTLDKNGMSEKWLRLNRVSVELAFEARERYSFFRPVLIAGSIAPVEDCYSPNLVPDENELLEEHAAQAELIAQLGVDFILGETLITIREAVAIAKAAQATGKEYALSFFCKDGEHLLSGETLADAIAAVEPYAPTALLVNCISYKDIHQALAALHRSTTLPVGCYANTGNPIQPEDEESHIEQVQSFAAESPRWIDMGARMIGGCCGTTPDHIYALSKVIRSRFPNAE